MKTAYSYQRWSTAIQGNEGKDSKIRQTETADVWIKDYGKALGYKLAGETFIDAGKSGFKGAHIAKDEFGRAKGELGKFIERVENGSIKNDSILLVDDFSRFSRLKPSQSLTLFLQVINSGIGLVFTGSRKKEIINTEYIDKEPDILSFIIGEVIRSYEESNERSRKVKAAKDGIKQQMKNGNVRINSNFPKFFTFISDTPSNPKCKTGKYIHNDKTALVKEMIEGIQAGKTMYAMADDFNQRQIKTFRYGNLWTGKAIRQILRNSILTGEFMGVKDYAPPLIDKDTFGRIKTILDGNKTNKGNRAKVINIFKGLCFCADCQRVMSFQMRKSPFHENIMDSPYRYLRCSVQGKNGGCQNRDYIRITDFEVEFFIFFLKQNPTALLNDSDSAELKELNKQITAKTTELNMLTADITKVASVVRTMDIEELKVKMAELTNQRDGVKGELDNLTSKLSTIQDTPKNLENIQKLMENFIDTVDYTPINEDTPLEIAEKKIELALKDSYTREGLRIHIRSLVGKVTVDTKLGKFFVYNRMGKLVYESAVQDSTSNASPLWRAAMQNWSTRKMKDGRIVKVNRKAS